MFKTFAEIESHIIRKEINKKVALACAEDEVTLNAVVMAKQKGLIKPILVGDVEKIKAILLNLQEELADYELIAAEDEKTAAELVVQLVKEGSADIPMKGLMQTSSFMKAILNKETGLLQGDNLLSQITVLENNDTGRLFLISDCAVNITPGVEEKKKIISNCIDLAKCLNYENPKVAIISAVEVVNPKIVSTIEAEELTEFFANDSNATVFGPLALDNAISKEAAEHKEIINDVAGAADVLIMPDLCSGNIFSKALTYYTDMLSAGVLAGTCAPVIMTSRTDTLVNKYNAILMAILQSRK